MDISHIGICHVAFIRIWGIVMEEIVEQYGVGLLQILGGIAAMVVYLQLYEKEGFLWNVLLEYFYSICG